jgi:hypothetical protein
MCQASFRSLSERINTSTVPSYGPLFITRASNQGEITLEEWLERATAWAEVMLPHHTQREPSAPD